MVYFLKDDLNDSSDDDSQSSSSGSSGSGSAASSPARDEPETQLVDQTRSPSGSPNRYASDGSEHNVSVRSRSRSKSGSVEKASSVVSRSRSSSSSSSSSKSSGRSSKSPPPSELTTQEESVSKSRLSSPDVDPSPTRLALNRLKAIISSDDNGSSDEEARRKNNTQLEKPKLKSAEVFGDLDEMSSDEDQPFAKTDIKELRSDNEDEDDEKRSDDGDREMDEEPVPISIEEAETRIDVDIPKISTDLGKGIHFVKLPNFLSVETRPFDPDTYEDEIDDEETLDEEGRARLKLKVENTIRWRERFDENGAFVKESNARFVRWSDGSMSLHLGSEIFNVYKQPLQGDHNHLFIRQGTGLQGQAVFRTKLSFRPHSTESFTHRKMTMSLADRSTKEKGIKVLSIVGANPEAHRDEMIKREDDKLRASVRRENKQRRTREKSSRGLSSSYLDDDYSDDENTISLSAIKSKYKKGGSSRAHNIYSSSDDDESSDLERGRRLEKAKRLKDSDEDDDGNNSETLEHHESGGEKTNSPAPKSDNEEEPEL